MFVLPLPINDGRSTRFPFVVTAITVLNAAVFLSQSFIGPEKAVFAQYGFTPATPQLVTVFTGMFLHAGFMHILGNMCFLWMFGPQVEDAFGRFWFGITYLLCGVSAAGLHFVLNSSSAVPCVGASGAISGIAGIFFVLFPKYPFELAFYFFRRRVGSITTRTHVAVGTWIGEQTVLGLLSTAAGVIGIAFWAHVGGFAAGAVAGLIYVWVVLAVRRERTRKSARHTEEDVVKG